MSRRSVKKAVLMRKCERGVCVEEGWFKDGLCQEEGVSMGVKEVVLNGVKE